MNKTLVSLLLISAAVFVTPASANWFSDVRQGVNRNIGSAPNPKPAYRPLTVEAPYITGPSLYTPAETPVEPIQAAAPPPLPPQIVAEAPPAPPPAIRRYVVFFDFDKSDLTVEAEDVVAAAVTAAKETGMVRVVITGHTDTVGSQRYNQALSERRAGAVKAELVRLGLDAREINAVGANFSEPLVPTGPGVREPQNRRAVIDLGYNLTATLVPNSETEQ
jgi:outer membrane protein OmpA-like peptidoglycan-associated protein